MVATRNVYVLAGLLVLLLFGCTPAPIVVPPAKPTPPVVEPPVPVKPKPEIPGPPVSHPGQDLPPELQQLLEQHNAERGNRNTAPLAANPDLNVAAQKHAQWMCDTNTMSHTGKDGSSVFKRVKDEGLSPTLVGENVAAGYRTTADVFKGWLGSSGHRANIYNRNYKIAGFGVARTKSGKPFWCVVFASGTKSEANALQVIDPTLLPDPIEADPNAPPDTNAQAVGK